MKLRQHIIKVVSDALHSLPYVLAGWQGGSVAFHLEDEYSDIDLNILLDKTASQDSFYDVVHAALTTISPIIATHAQPPGRYFKLEDGGDFLLVDVCVYEVADLPQCLDTTRHGNILPLFDKGEWLEHDPEPYTSQNTKRKHRLKEHKEWFSISQNFVQKAIFRGRDIEALASYWGYTLRPLVELLRMKYCPERWDFGMRYLERDLPTAVYNELCILMFIKEPDDLTMYLGTATAWAERLIHELHEDET